MDGLSRIRLSPDAHVIARHGEQFLVTYMTGVESTREYRRGLHPGATFWLVRSAPSGIGRLIAEHADQTVALLSHEELIRLDESAGRSEQEAIRSSNPHWRKYAEAINPN